ncbi:uncharacterized protein LOC122648767 [Telopea speciosissima]|uniref:uncharacterized protein LOC122648767 n=1 Tax=Telopea speciosissima TaxID=54955 RepID=UPI001CC60622|nr:uncharacterized protein LOC122648767 [Telopea speciosissima]
MDGNRIADSVQSKFWDFRIPKKKRSMNRGHSLSPVEKLRRDLVDILQQQESSSLTGYSEEVLIFKKEDPWFSAEIGLGAIQLKPSLSFTGEESEASSLIMEKKVSCLNNVEKSCLSLLSQSSEGSTGQESNRLIQETGDAEELKVNVAKQSAIANKYSGTILLSNPDILQNTNSPHMHINWKPENDKSFTTMNKMTEATSCLSRFIGGGISLHAATNPNLPYIPYLPTSGGPNFGTIEGFKRPKERMVGHNTSSSISMPAFSIGRNSSILPLPNFGVETSYIDVPVYPRNTFPVFRLPNASTFQKEANWEETRSAAEIIQHPNNRNIN